MRDAPSRAIIGDLLERGATLIAYDPVAMHEARRIFGGEPRLTLADTALAAATDADALIIATEWKEFRSPDFRFLKSTLKSGVIFDGRNLYEPAVVAAAGLKYIAIGRAV